MKIGMTSIYVSDPIGAFKFYTDTLGFIERMFIPEANLAIIASMKDADGAGLLLEPNENPIAKTYQNALYAAGIPVITMVSEDIQAEYEELKELGVAFKKPPIETEWGIEAIFEDTFGNYIQLVQL